MGDDLKDMKETKQGPIKNVSLKKNITLSTFYQILTLITPLITAPYISRVLGDKQIGIYSYTNSLETYFGLFAALGTVSYGNRAIARERNNPKERSVLFWEIELLTVLTSVIMLAAWGILVACSRQYRIYYLILTISLVETMMNISWFFSGLEQFTYTVRQNTIFKLLGIVLLFTFVRKESDLWLYVLIMTGSSFLGTVSMWLYLPKFLVPVKRSELRVLRHFRETMVYFIPTIATSVYTVLDKTLLQWITSDPYENGYYEQATKIVNMVKAVTFTAINSVLGSRIAYLFKEQKYDEIHRRIEDSVNYILFIGIGAVLGIIGIADRFVPFFFGSGYDPVINVLRLLSPVVIVIGISNCLGSQYYTPAGLKRQSARYIVTGSVVNLSMNLIFIPQFKSMGAVIGTLIAESTITVLYVRNSNGYLKVNTLTRLAWKKLIAGAVMVAVVRLIVTRISSNAAAVLLSVAMGGGVYLLVIYLLRDSFLTEVVGERLLKGKLKRFHR